MWARVWLLMRQNYTQLLLHDVILKINLTRTLVFAAMVDETKRKSEPSPLE